MHVLFPHQLLRQAAQFGISGQSMPSTSSISGATTVRPSLGAKWEAIAAFVMRTEEQHLAFRAFLAGMEGALGTTDVPAFSRFRPHDRDGHGVVACDIAKLSDAQTFEHFGFQNAPLESAILTESASLRATRIKVTYPNSTGLRPGHRFSINGRLHEVQLSWTEGGSNILQIQPPLRNAAGAGAVIEMHAPRCLMRFSSPDRPAYDDAMPRMQSVTLNFIEAI